MFTPFFPFFAILALIALRSPRAWVGITALTTVLQSASPLALPAGGRIIGIHPTYALLIIGLLHVVLDQIRSSNFTRRKTFLISPTVILLFLFTVYGACHAVVVPRLLQGAVLVMEPRTSIDEGFVEPLRPSPGNYIQAFYLSLNFALVFLINYVVVRFTVDFKLVLRGFFVGLCIAILAAWYQLAAFYAGLPWPASVINSNRGVAQLYGQVAHGFPRLSSTFWEPSSLAVHLLPFFSYLVFNRCSTWLILAVGGTLFLSTSTTAYAGLIVIVTLFLLLEAFRGRVTKLYIYSLVLCISFAIAIPVLKYFGFDEVLITMTADKLTTASGRNRLAADGHAIDVMLHTWGIGVGIGSNRASSVIPALLSTIGVPGISLFLAVFGTTIYAAANSATEAKKLIPAILAYLGAWSVTTPDLSYPLIWTLVGLCIAYVRASSTLIESNPVYKPAMARAA